MDLALATVRAGMIKFHNNAKNSEGDERKMRTLYASLGLESLSLGILRKAASVLLPAPARGCNKPKAHGVRGELRWEVCTAVKTAELP